MTITPMHLTPTQSASLHAAIDRFIPADDWPSASQSGVMEFLIALFTTDAAPKAPQLLAGLDALEAESRFRHNSSFAQLQPQQQDALLGDVEAGVTQVFWPTPPESFFELLLTVTGEGYFANTHHGQAPPAWAMIGYESGANRP